MQYSHKYFIFLMLFLGALSAFGPFITDMYLPTLPSMKEAFDTSTSMVQLGLTFSLLGLSLGQLFFGPLSDKYGRRPILGVSMMIFSVSALACVFSPTIEFFLACRFLQGIGGAGGIVLSRSIATDCATGRELAKLMAIIGAINGVAPITAPVIGGLVSESVGWRGIFIILLCLGLVLGCCVYYFRETNAPEHRTGVTLSALLRSYPSVLRIKAFTYPMLAYSASIAALFAYISSAPFIVQTQFGFSEFGFSLIFATNALGMAFGAALALKFRTLANALMFSTTALLALSVIQVIVSVMSPTFYVYEGLMLVMCITLGMIFPSSTTLAMDAGRRYTGAAAAIVGGAGFLLGGIVSPIVGMGDQLTYSSSIYVVASLIAVLLALVVKRAHASSQAI